MCYTDLLAHLSKLNGDKGTGWKWWDIAPLPTAQALLSARLISAFPEDARVQRGGQHELIPEATPLKGKTVHRDILIY